jgi:hypothetical protein
MIVAIHHQARSHKLLDQASVTSDMFAQSVGDLDNAPNSSAAIPVRARDAQSICAGELELVRLDRIYVSRRPRSSPIYRLESRVSRATNCCATAGGLTPPSTISLLLDVLP